MLDINVYAGCICALGRTRTCNLLIRSQVLYPLSYERISNRSESLPGQATGLQNGPVASDGAAKSGL
jgi:hypothetical protein